jgi:hypothetical protein
MLAHPIGPASSECGYIWRCEAQHEPLGSVFDLDAIPPDQREPCNACMMACYRFAIAQTANGNAGLDGPFAVVTSQAIRYARRVS